MRHPFDGINEPVNASRRTWLGMFAAVAGFFGFSSLVNAAGPSGNRMRVTNPVPEPSPEPPRPVATPDPGETGKAPPPKVTSRKGESGGLPLLTTAKGEGAKEPLREVTYRKGESGGLPRVPGRAMFDKDKEADLLREAEARLRLLTTTPRVRKEGARK